MHLSQCHDYHNYGTYPSEICKSKFECLFLLTYYWCEIVEYESILNEEILSRSFGMPRNSPY